MAGKLFKSTSSQIDVAEQALQQIANCLGYLVVHTDELKGKSNNDLNTYLGKFGL